MPLPPVRVPRALNDPARLAALQRTGLLDSLEEETFDRFTRLAARLAGASMATFSLIDDRRQFAKSIFGIGEMSTEERSVPLDLSFCRYVAESGEALVVPDTHTHELLCDNPSATEGGIAAYLGVPVYTTDGFALGSLCVFGVHRREWSDDERRALEELSELITTELDLRTSERRFRAIVEATSHVTFLADVQGDVTNLRRLHPSAEAQTEQHHTGWEWTDTLHPDDCMRVTTEWAKAARAHRPFVSEHRRRGDNGAYRWCRTHIVPVLDDQGRFVEFVGTYADIDEARRAKDDLERQTAILQSFFDTVPIMVGVVEVYPDDVAFVIVNAATHSFFARSDEPMQVKSVAEVAWDTDALAHWLNAYQTTIRSGKPVRFTQRYILPSADVYLEVVVNLVGYTDSGVPLCSFSADDVTERRAAERRLATSEQYLQMAVESAQIGVWEYDFESDRGTWSPQTCAIHGVVAFDGRVATALRQVVQADRASVTKPFRSAMRRAVASGGADVSMEYRVVVDGDERWIRTLGRVYAEAGRLTRMAGVSQDVTDQKRHAQALEEARAAALEAKARAEEAVRLKTGIISNMSHEIRTPLTAILGFAELLAEEPDEPDPETVSIIQTSAQRLLDTLNSVLYFAQLESGVPFDAHRVDVVRIVRDAVHPYASRARAKHLSLSVSAPTHPVWLRTNRDAVDRLVGHLVSNAVKFTNEGRIDVRVEMGEGHAWIEVADTGIGMAPSFVETAFEPFRQESDGMSRTFEGSGLGLSIVRRLTDLLGAQLDVQSERGVGSTLRVWLPLDGVD